MADDRPAWFDPEQDLMLTPRSLRGLVHPLRVRLLQLLQDDGPATATALGARMGQSSGVTSYHLRVLAEHGLIAEDTERGTGRDRWWRPVYRSVSFSYRAPGEPADEATQEFMRLRADQMHRQLVDYIDGMARRGDRQTLELFRTGRWPLRLTPEQATQILDAIEELLLPYRRTPEIGDGPADGERVVFQYQLLPEDDQ